MEFIEAVFTAVLILGSLAGIFAILAFIADFRMKRKMRDNDHPRIF